MADMICPCCGEPWDTVHIRSDMDYPAPWPRSERPAEAATYVRKHWSTAPPEIVELTERLAIAETAYINTRGMAEDHPRVVALDKKVKTARDELGKAVYATGLAKGCPACWDEPDRIPTDPDQQQENLRAAIFDGVWDGDPAEFFA